MKSAVEVNFDGLVGPTHNYAGLSRGNVASTAHQGLASNPREAALQGLAKMKALADLGVPQAVLPPHDRPDVASLRALGFSGKDAAVLGAAARQAPALLAACGSASAMWVANAATVTPGADAGDGRVHFTPANLVSKFHRSIEPPQTARILRAIFRDEQLFAVHDPVPGAAGCGDEGAANHTRFASPIGERGVHLFAYGHHAFGADGLEKPRRFPSRQALEASRAVVRTHGLPAKLTVYAQQSPAAIDAGVFHNDVISTGHENLFLCHEAAFVDTVQVIKDLDHHFRKVHWGKAQFLPVVVPSGRVSLADAVQSYLFNSQIVTLKPGRMALIAPVQCRELPAVRGYVEELIAKGKTPLREVHYFDLRESMSNGGGPACLRLRVVLTAREQTALPPEIFLTPATHAGLVRWVKKHYRDVLRPADLADPALLEESRRALDELTQLLGIGSIYSFQGSADLKPAKPARRAKSR